MFLYVQLDPVHVAPMRRKAENENLSAKLNRIYPSVTAWKVFCSKAEFFNLVSNNTYIIYVVLILPCF